MVAAGGTVARVWQYVGGVRTKVWMPATKCDPGNLRGRYAGVKCLLACRCLAGLACLATKKERRSTRSAAGLRPYGPKIQTLAKVRGKARCWSSARNYDWSHLIGRLTLQHREMKNVRPLCWPILDF